MAINKPKAQFLIQYGSEAHQEKLLTHPSFSVRSAVADESNNMDHVRHLADHDPDAIIRKMAKKRLAAKSILKAFKKMHGIGYPE